MSAAIGQAKVSEAVWFTFKGNAYVVVDNGDAATEAEPEVASFEAGVDSVIQLVGVDLTNASFNTGTGTVSLI